MDFKDYKYPDFLTIKYINDEKDVDALDNQSCYNCYYFTNNNECTLKTSKKFFTKNYYCYSGEDFFIFIRSIDKIFKQL